MSDSPDRPAKAFSCIRCFERKVKCDKLSPCSNCIRSKTECVFRVPPAPRRRKKRPQEDVLLARLKKCEELLKSKGISIDTPQNSAQSSGPATEDPASGQLSPEAQYITTSASFFGDRLPDKPGQLITDHGKSRFLENTLWTSVSEEFRQPNEAIAEYSEDEDDIGSPVGESTDFLLGYTPSSSIQQLHPSPDHIMLLWQVFLDNINPMTKLVHRPTLHEALVTASTNLDTIPRGLEALMFAIYSAAVFSMEDDECEMKLGDQRKALLARYRHATRKALGRARFMGTSELVVLQAFLLYLLTMREDYDSRTTWILAGVASRVAQGMGIHRDGTNLGVSPFETEMRRRLWWQIATLDFRSAELSGSGRFGDWGLSDSQLPSNVNDEDIHPDMTESPISQTRPTEMISCLLRCEFGAFWKEKLMSKSSSGFENLRITTPWNSTLEERDANINELEQRIEEKFLRYCDPSIPIQFLAIIIGRAAVTSMRLMAHHPRKYARPEDVPQSERDYLWKLSVKLLESDNLAHSSKGLHRFMWHTNVYFQWQAFVYLLNELKQHTMGDEVDKAWQQVDELFRHHPNFVTDYKKPLHVAVGSLCLKAYNAREKALRDATKGVFPKIIPEYIKLLREQRETGPLRSSPVAKEETLMPANAIHVHQRQTSDILSPYSNNPTNPASSSASSYTSAMTFTQQPPHIGGSQTTKAPTASPQIPLPAFQSMPLPSSFAGSGDGLMYPSDPSLAQELAMADMPMDWAQWDYIMQDFTEPS